MHPEFLQVIMRDRVGQIERAAASARPVRPEPRPPADDPIGLRLCRVYDEAGLLRLAELEGRALPAGDFVIAESAGSIVAALPLNGGAAFADPFRATAHVLPLLELRAAQLRNAHYAPRPPRRALRRLMSR